MLKSEPAQESVRALPYLLRSRFIEKGIMFPPWPEAISARDSAESFGRYDPPREGGSCVRTADLSCVADLLSLMKLAAIEAFPCSRIACHELYLCIFGNTSLTLMNILGKPMQLALRLGRMKAIAECVARSLSGFSAFIPLDVAVRTDSIRPCAKIETCSLGCIHSRLEMDPEHLNAFANIETSIPISYNLTLPSSALPPNHLDNDELPGSSR